jgi:hypothetical protein
VSFRISLFGWSFFGFGLRFFNCFRDDRLDRSRLYGLDGIGLRYRVDNIYFFIIEILLNVFKTRTEGKGHDLRECTRTGHIEEVDSPSSRSISEFEISTCKTFLLEISGGSDMKLLTEVFGNGRLPDLFLSGDHLHLSSSRVFLHLIERKVGSDVHVSPVVSHDRLLPRVHGYVGLSLWLISLVVLDTPSNSEDGSLLELFRSFNFGKDFHSVGACGSSDNLQLALEGVALADGAGATLIIGSNGTKSVLSGVYSISSGGIDFSDKI